MSLTLTMLLLLAAGIATLLIVVSANRRRASTGVIDAYLAEDLESAAIRHRKGDGWLRRWLFLAGFRQDSASSVFVWSTVAAALSGAGLGLILSYSGLVDWMGASLASIPGGVGEALTGTIQIAPWTVFGMAAFTPTLVVRARRRERVMQIEQDLPITLDLFATLAEAGLSFDASLARIQESQSQNRPLAAEFRTYQGELLAGVPRIQALRQLAQRMEVTSVTSFVSALVQAEQVGASLASTLRRQAEDARDRRRMRAMLLAQALPVKLVFPLIACFLPGIFVSTLGPALYQMVKVVDSVIRTGR